jgi:hypothetical protein
MNERIKELAIKAGAVNVWEWASDDVLDTKNMDAEKFAELIVAECNKINKETCNELKADESIQTPGSKINWNLYNATLRNKLAEHFWVEL